MAIVGIRALLVYIYARPHEFIEALKDFQWLYLLLGIALIGIVLDYAGRRSKFAAHSTLRNAVLIFAAWAMFTLILRRPDLVFVNGITIMVSTTLFLVCMHGITTSEAFFKVAVTIFALGFFVATIGAHQGFQPFVCLEGDPLVPKGHMSSDGRPCFWEMDGLGTDGVMQCIEGGQPGRRYACERAGLLGTTSIGGGRVRYLGQLEDPNELGLATSMCIPFAFAFFENRKSLFRLLLLITTLGLVGVTNFFTKSRGGQLVFSVVLAAYFVRRFRAKGFILAGLVAAPLIALGGREGEEADQSVIDRLEAAAAGIKMMIGNPIMGVGYAQFNEYHYLTAHNAYVLAVGELGLTGMFMYVTIVYLTIKIPVVALRHTWVHDDDEARQLKSLSMAMLATFCGAAVGIFFLSWTYHFVFWIHLGLAGALFSVIKAKEPTYEVRFSFRELGGVMLVSAAMLVVLYAQIKRKGLW